MQADFGGFYSADSAKLIASEATRGHGQEAVDRLIGETGLERIIGFRTGTRFTGGFALDP